MDNAHVHSSFEKVELYRVPLLHIWIRLRSKMKFKQIFSIWNYTTLFSSWQIKKRKRNGKKNWFSCSSLFKIHIEPKRHCSQLHLSPICLQSKEHQSSQKKIKQKTNGIHLSSDDSSFRLAPEHVINSPRNFLLYVQNLWPICNTQRGEADSRI